MFEHSPIMVMLEEKGQSEIYKLETNRNTQSAICSIYEDAYQNMYASKEMIKFDGKYTPDSEEMLYIEGFAINDSILEAIRNPAGIEAFIPELDENRIKATFVGEVHKGSYTIAFQKFKKDQYISTRGINLFFDKNTFFQEKRFGICISDEIDCVFTDNKLAFHSYFMAKQIFDLKDYYRTATDNEVQHFTEIETLEIASPELFKSQADSRIRRNIASIIDSGVLKQYSAKKIQTMGRQTGIGISVKNNKIVIPSTKKEMKVVLGFLDDHVYKGVFSQETFITNSKRPVNGI